MRQIQTDWKHGFRRITKYLFASVLLSVCICSLHAPERKEKSSHAYPLAAADSQKIRHPEQSEGSHRRVSSPAAQNDRTNLQYLDKHESLKVKKLSNLKTPQGISYPAFALFTSSPTKIITPNGDKHNDEFLLTFENPAGSLVTQKKIYDITGAEVADFEALTDETANPVIFRWNGRDRNGEMVRSGVYIYQVQAEGKVVNGTIVVAR